MIIRTEAVVLRAMEYGETSLIATLFTREKGKLSVLAKGARLMNSRFGATLQPMAYTQVVFYFKPARGLQTLRESAHVQPLPGIGRDLEKLSVGLRMVELVYALMQEHEHNPQVFNLLVQALGRLDGTERHAANLVPYFQLRLSMVLGFSPRVDRAAVEALPEAGGLLALDDGSVLPPQAATQASRRASRTALRAYAVFARADLDAVMRMRLPHATRREVDALIEAYLKYHVEDAYPARSDRVHHQLLADEDAPGPVRHRPS